MLNFFNTKEANEIEETFFSLIKKLEKKMIEKIMGKIGEEEEFS